MSEVFLKLLVRFLAHSGPSVLAHKRSVYPHLVLPETGIQSGTDVGEQREERLSAFAW